MDERIILHVKIVVKHADRSETLVDEIDVPLVSGEDEEYLTLLKFREPLDIFNIRGCENLRARLVEIYNDYIADRELEPGDELEVRYTNTTDDVPMSKKEAEETIREMFEDPDWDIDQIARYCKFNFARCYKGSYPALIKLAKSIGKDYEDEDELEDWFW